MLFSRRRKYYLRCQDIIDELHQKVANGEFMSEEQCKLKYGKSDYNALLHELHLMNAGIDYRSMTPAMEWIYHSQYFKRKSNEETVECWKNIIIVATAIAALISAYSAYKSANSKRNIDIYHVCPCTSDYQINQCPNPIAKIPEGDKLPEVKRENTATGYNQGGE